MASTLSSMLGRTETYKPSPRFSHFAALAGVRCFLWGHVPDFSANGREQIASTVEIFDPCLEVWEQKATSGVSPSGLYDGACASLSDQLYSFGGIDSGCFCNSLHTMDTTSLEWKTVRVLNPGDGPMRKRGCKMVAFSQDRLALLGGYGIPTGPTQPGATLTKSTRYGDGRGWSNELHIFNINEGNWSSPTTTGPRPLPSSYMSFTAINDHQAVMFGGNQSEEYGYVSDCYLINFKTMEWTKLVRPVGAPWPAGRDSHAACCLNYGQDDPQVLVTGGVDENLNVLNDMWILDIKSGKWRELTLPEGVQSRLRHTVTAFSLGPERTQVIMVGGCPKWDMRKGLSAQAKIEETTVLDFESVQSPSSGGGTPTREWVLVGVASGSQLGSEKRVREKLVNLQHSVVREVEAGRRQAHQEARSQQALDRRVHDAEARAQDLQIQLKASQDAYQESLQQSQQSLQESQQSLQESQQSLQESQQSLQESQQSLQQSQQSLQESQQSLQESRQFHLESQQSLQASQAEKRFLDGALQESQAEKTALQEMLVSAEQSVQEAEDQVRHLQQSVDEASARTEALQRRVEVAEHRAREAERRARDARQGESEGEPSWVVQRDEINLTDTEVGRGGWAVVRVAEFRGARFAAKCLYRQIVSNYNRLLFTREMNVASRVRHPNLLQFIGATLRGELIILTELMPTSVRGELENECTFLENQITSISLDVARALNYLHLMQPSPIIHRDISSANVLLEPGPNNSWRAKVSDYGSVNLLGRLRTVTPGNPTYAAPEAENTALQSPKMDIFSFGVLLVEMCSAQFPEVADREHLICSIQHPGMVALIRRCLAEDRTARPSASDLITELNEHSA